MHDPLSQLKRVQQYRQRRERDVSIRSLIEQTASAAQKTHRKLGTIIELWDELVPVEIRQHTTINTLRAGTLHVTVDSAATSYELDRMLRGGLEQDLRRRYTGTLMRVRIKIGEEQSDARS